jgi:hypothetical protein
MVSIKEIDFEVKQPWDNNDEMECNSSSSRGGAQPMEAKKKRHSVGTSNGLDQRRLRRHDKVGSRCRQC